MRQPSSTSTRRALAVVAVAIVAAACGTDDPPRDSAAAPSSSERREPSPASEPASPSAAHLSIALGAAPTSLDPHLVDDGSERAVDDNIYEPLLFMSADGVLEPGLASALPTRVDDVTWEFELRDDVTFQDGTRFDSSAVVATVERMVRLIEQDLTDNADYFVTLAGAEAVDADTVRVVTTVPDGALPARMNWLRIVAPAAASSNDISDASNGTGPYSLAGHEPGVSIELSRKRDYWGDVPSFESVSYAFVPEAGTRIAGLKSGQYDLITNLAAGDVDQVPQSVQAAGVEHPVLILDAEDGVTADADVRRALNYAVDKEAIAEVVYGGGATVDAGQILSPTLLGFNDEIEAYPYDPALAKQMIVDAGAAGQTITIVGESGRWVNDRDLLEAVASYWTEAGLTVDLQILEFSAWLDEFFDPDSQPDALWVSASLDLLDPDRAVTTLLSPAGQASGNDNPALLELVDGARAELDPAARDEMYQEIGRIAHEEAYLLFLVNTADIYGLSERVAWTPRIDARLIVREMSFVG